MKNLILFFCLCLSANVITAQNIIDDKFNHLKNLDNATEINLSAKLFSFAANFTDSGEKEMDEMAEFASTITGFKLIALQDHKNCALEYKSGLNYIGEDFDELVKIRSKDGNFSLYIDETNNIVHELVGIGTDNNEFIVFSLTGAMDLKKVGEFASEINMDGFDKMESIKDFDVADVKLYPNPVSRSGDLTLDTPSQFEGGVATLIDENGRVVKTYSIKGKNQSIDTNNLNAGIYYMELSKDAVSVKKKIVVIN